MNKFIEASGRASFRDQPAPMRQGGSGARNPVSRRAFSLRARACRSEAREPAAVKPARVASAVYTGGSPRPLQQRRAWGPAATGFVALQLHGRKE